MDIKLLDAFRAVMESQSMTGAAKLLGLTQPAISAQIARLEAEVGFELFERGRGRLRASDDGRRFYEEVKNALGSIERLTQVADSIRTGASEAITIASHPSASISVLPGVVAKLRGLRPEARVHMINRTSESVRAMFESGAADIAIAEWPINLFPGMEIRRYEVDCLAILPEGHRLAAEPVITPTLLSGEPFIAMNETRALRHQVRALFSNVGASYLPVVDSEYFATICRMVAAGCGVSIVDRWSAETFAGLGLVCRPFEPRIVYEIGVFYRSAPPLPPLAEDVLTLIEEALGKGVVARLAPEGKGEGAQ